VRVQIGTYQLHDAFFAARLRLPPGRWQVRVVTRPTVELAGAFSPVYSWVVP
jgi:hypothetical protein